MGVKMEQYKILIWDSKKNKIGERNFLDLELAIKDYNEILFESYFWGYIALIKGNIFTSLLSGFDLIFSAKNKGVIYA